MSITRSPGPREPATDRFPWRHAGLILVAHGSEADGGANAGLARHVAALRERHLFAGVVGAALYGKPDPVDAMGHIRAPVAFVAPLLMCDGMFVREVLPARFERNGIGETGPRLWACPPLGENPALSGLIARRAARMAIGDGIVPGDCALLLIAHGSSRDGASCRAARAQARRLRSLCMFASVETAFLDQVPHLDDVLARLRGPLVVVGLFADADAHAAVDVPSLLARHGRDGAPHLPAIGTDDEIPDLIVHQVTRLEGSFRP